MNKKNAARLCKLRGVPCNPELHMDSFHLPDLDMLEEIFCVKTNAYKTFLKILKKNDNSNNNNNNNNNDAILNPAQPTRTTLHWNTILQ